MDFNDDSEVPEVSEPGDQKTISQFDETVEYYMRTGLNYTAAKHKAIDEYRKYGSREVTVSKVPDFGSSPADQDMQEEERLFGPDTRPTQDVTTMLSDTVRKFLEGTPNERDRKYFVVLLRAHGVDQHLDEDALDLMSSITEEYPESSKRKDIAKALGFKVKDNGSTSSMYLIHQTIKEKFVALFGSFGRN